MPHDVFVTESGASDECVLAVTLEAVVVRHHGRDSALSHRRVGQSLSGFRQDHHLAVIGHFERIR